MKKRRVLFGIVGVLLMVFLMMVRVNQINDTAVFQKVNIGNEYSCQTVNMSGKSYLYVWNNNTKECVFTSVDKGQDEFEVLDAVCFSKVYYQYRFLGANGRWQYGIGSYELDTKEINVLQEWQCKDDEWLAFGGSESEQELYYVAWNEEAQQVNEYKTKFDSETLEWEIIRMIPTKDVVDVCGAYYDEDGALNICNLEGGSYIYGKGTEVTIKDWAEFCANKIQKPAEQIKTHYTLTCMWDAAESMVLGYVVFMVVLWFLVNGICDKHSLVIRMYCLAELVVLLIVVVFAAVYTREVKLQTSATQIQMAKNELSNLSTLKQGNGEIPLDEMEKLVEKGLFTDVIEVNTSDMTVNKAVKIPVGVVTEDYYGSEVNLAVIKALADNEVVLFDMYHDGSKTTGIAFYDWNNIGKKSTLVGIVNAELTEDILSEAFEFEVVYIITLFAIVSIILGVSSWMYQKRWKQYIQTAETVVIDKGRYKGPDRNPGGMSAMWDSFQEMNKIVDRLEYEKQQNALVYSRFVPKNLATFFEKESFAEIKKEGVTNIQGTMVQMSMNSLRGYSGSQYMRITDMATEILLKVLEKNCGIMLQNNPDNMQGKYFFKENLDNAMCFATELLNEYRQNEELNKQSKLLVLHIGEYDCGITGTDEQYIPFAYSKEDELLGHYEEELRQAGLNLVVTENVLNKISNRDYEMRYIGYISDAATGKGIKIYECLDGYSEEKHKVLSETLQLFEKALNLFYSDDYYLARNTFNKVIQMNPDDQIAKWYLFNCEYFLNEAANMEVSHGLYENRMFEQGYQR